MGQYDRHISYKQRKYQHLLMIQLSQSYDVKFSPLQRAQSTYSGHSTKRVLVINKLRVVWIINTPYLSAMLYVSMSNRSLLIGC